MSRRENDEDALRNGRAYELKWKKVGPQATEIDRGVERWESVFENGSRTRTAREARKGKEAARPQVKYFSEARKNLGCCPVFGLGLGV